MQTNIFEHETKLKQQLLLQCSCKSNHSVDILQLYVYRLSDFGCLEILKP